MQKSGILYLTFLARVKDSLWASTSNQSPLPSPTESSLNTHSQTLKEQCRQLALRDRHHEFLDLVRDLPPETVQADPDLAFWNALCLLSTVQYVEGKESVERYIHHHAAPNDPLTIGRTHLLRSHLCIMEGSTEASYAHELKAVQNLPGTAWHERLRSWSTIDTMAGHMGNNAMIEQAISALAEVRNHLPFDQSWWYTFVVPNRADILAKRGFLDEAEKLLLAQIHSVPPEDTAIINLRLATIALERRDPEKANSLLGEVTVKGPSAYWSSEAVLISSQVSWLLGETETAIKTLQSALSEWSRQMVRAEHFRVQMELCQLWIQQGAFELADAWIGLASKALDPWPRTFGHPIPDLVRAQLEMARGSWSLAIELLESLRDEGLKRGHTGLLVSIYAHLAYAFAGSGDTTKAIAWVNEAVAASTNGNFARSLTVFGIDVRSFLTHIPAANLEVGLRVSQDSRRTLLSQREIEVLQLVGNGKRNAEIAETLFVSQSTVKNHLSNIFKRLGVKTRRDAVFAARSMGILSGER